MGPEEIYMKEGFVAFCLVATALFLAWIIRTLMGVGIKTIEKVGTNIEANTSTLLSIASSGQRIETKLEDYGDTLSHQGETLNHHSLELEKHGNHLEEIRQTLRAKQA